LRAAGVRLVYGEDVWPLHRPRAGGAKELPWARSSMRSKLR
jgi:hypothetical protein